VTGLGLAVEIGDWNRFTGTSIGAYLGLTPSEHSTGSSRVLGSITKTGNTHAPANSATTGNFCKVVMMIRAVLPANVSRSCAEF
jgi:transposase